MFYPLFALFMTLLGFANVQALTAPAYEISTLGGSGDSGFSGDGGLGRAAELALPNGVAADTQGNIYIADKYNHRIRKITPDGTISTFAGSGAAGYSGDGGQATAAKLNMPLDVAVDSQNRVYVVDHGNHAIRRIDSNGVIRTIAGQGKEGSVNDGKAASTAYLRRPSGLGIDAQDTVYIADSGNHRIRKITPDGIIHRIVGASRNGGFSGDGGAALAANLKNPLDVAVDSQGTIYIADTDNHRIRKIDSAGIISSLAGGASFGYTADGSAAKYALLYKPSSVALDAQNRLFIADSYNHRIRMIDTQGLIHTVAGSGLSEIGNGGFFGDGVLAGRARLFNPQGLGVDAQGQVFIADSNNQRVRKLTPVGDVALIESVVGTRTTGLNGGGFSGDGGAAKEAQLKQAQGIAFDAQGNLYIADTGNHRLRKVTPDGMIKTLVGSGEQGSELGGGNALAAQLNAPVDVSADAAGNLYIADYNNHRVLKLDPQARLSVFAGNGNRGASGDGGAADKAQLYRPAGLALGADGSLYIADSGNHRIRHVDRQGVIRTLAGNGKAGSGGDGGAATQASLKTPTDVAVDSVGNLYIADRKNYRIRKVDSSGIISTVAGIGRAGYGNDGEALKERVDEPNGLTFDGQGNLYFSERNTDRVRKLTATGEIVTVAGTGGLGFSADGDPALTAQMYAPAGVAIDPRNGDLFIADTFNHRIRRVYEPKFQLVVQVSGPGQVSVAAENQAAQHCDRHCRYFYPPNTRVNVQASAATDAIFAGWELCANGDKAQLTLNLTADTRCQANFSAVLPPPPEAEPPPSTEPEPSEPEATQPSQPQPPAQALPALTSRQDCASVEQAVSLDLSANTDGQSILGQINRLPVFANSQLTTYQDAQRGHLILEQGPLRLSVQPIVARLSSQPLEDLNNALQLGLQQETLLRLRQNDGNVLDLFAQPALQDLCGLQKHAASLGYPKIRVNSDGNLRLQAADHLRPWLSLRPDWIATAITQDIPDGLLLSGTLFPNRYPSLSLIFTDSKGQKRQQFFYTAPAHLAVLQEAVENLKIQPFTPWQFSWQGNNYQGIWHQQVQPSTGEAEFDIVEVSDMNSDGTVDYRVTYPNGEQQVFFAH